MGKQRREQSQDSIFVDNPFVDGFLEWMGSREGRQCIEVRDVLWDLLTRLRLRPTSCIECLPHSGWHGSLIGAFHTTVKFTAWFAKRS